MNQQSGPFLHAFAALAFPQTMKRWLPLAIIIMLPALACAENAATNSLPSDLTTLSIDELMNIEVPTVTGATKIEQKTTEAPSSVTIITATEVKRYGHRTLADILQSVQGFHVSYDRNYSFLGTRGVNLGDFNSRVLVLIDGHRVNNNLTDGAAIDTAFLLDVDLIDRVEIIRGPGSVLYGNNAFFGVINVITRQGKQINGAETSGEYAEFDTYKGRVTLGKQFTNGIQFMLSGTIYDSEGDDRLFYKEFDTPAQNNGVARGLDDDSFGSAFGSVSYKDFTLEGGFIKREKVNPTGQFSLSGGTNFFISTFNDSRLRTTDERSYAALKYAHSFPEIVDVTARVYYDRYDFEIGYPQTVFDGTGTNVIASGFSRENNRGEWWGTELQLNKRLWDKHIVTIGAEYRDDFLQEKQVSGQVPISTNRQSHGIYVQGDFEVLTNLHFNGGVRYDQYGDFDPAFNPRLALIYNPRENSTLKAIYGTAFRVPNFLELSNPSFQDLDPEEITGYELVYEQKITRNFRSSVSGFYNQMDDLIVFESGNFRNINLDTKGVELALEGGWTNGIRGRASYSFQQTDNQSDSLDMADSPAHLVKFNLSVPLVQEKLFASLEFQYTSQRESLHNTTDAANQPLTVQGEEVGDFAIVNFTLFSQNLIENLEMSATVYNLFDTRYGDPASRFHQQDIIERDGRSFRFKLTYRF